MTSPSPAPAAKGGDSKHAPITVFVSTCQLPVFASAPEDGDESKYTAPPAFKATKFPTRVLPTAKVEELRSFLMSQWAITKSPYIQLPCEEQFFTFKGRLLRLDGALDAYYIMNNDTIYLRFSSMGKICDPWAMSTSELRAELKARNAYETKLQPEQLMLRLQEHVMKESRMQRLQQATRKEEVEQVVLITKELAAFQAKMRVETKRRETLTPSVSGSGQFSRPASLKWPNAPSPNRTVFLSITELERTHQLVPRDKQQFDYKYMCFEKDFLEMLTLKEEAGMVHWFRPQKSYEKLSVFISSFDDPVTKKKYNPLMLKESKWLTLCGISGWEGKMRQDGRKRDASKIPQFTKSIARILTNIQSQSFEYLAVQEILHQSNPTLLFASLK
ncbi:hypothetical protein Gpo141_00007635 [Globisporangium polare]